VAARQEFPWRAVAIVLGVLLVILLARWVLGFVWWLGGTLLLLAVVAAIVWAVLTVTRSRR
jgi:hypothetical protein